MNLENLITLTQETFGVIGTTLLLLLAAIVGGLIIHKILFALLRRWGRFTKLSFVHLFDQYLYSPTQLIFILLSLLFVSPFLDIPFEETISHIFTICFIASVAYLLVRVINLSRDVLSLLYDVKAENNLYARKISTQFKIIERVLVFLIIIFSIAAALMTFDKIREVGVSLMASAGIVGIIVGFAAQKSLSTLLAGIQIAISQPIRIDDVVIVEGEWGRIEEITLTYVVVKTWDERRLIVPINYFIEKPFQSWTRSSTQLIGTVFIYADYSAPISEMRKEFDRLVKSTPLWDGRVAALQVTNTSEKTIEIRIIASADNAPKTFDLRCMLRESMITFLQKNYPNSLPRTRVEVNKLAEVNSDNRDFDLFRQQERGGGH